MATVPHGHLHPTRLTTSLEPLNRLSTVPPPSVKRMPPPPPPSRVLNSQSRLDGSHPTHGVPSQQSLPSSRPTPISTPLRPAQSYSDQQRHLLTSSRITSGGDIPHNPRSAQSVQVPATPSNRFAIPAAPYGTGSTRTNMPMVTKGTSGGQRHPFIPGSGQLR